MMPRSFVLLASFSCRCYMSLHTALVCMQLPRPQGSALSLAIHTPFGTRVSSVHIHFGRGIQSAAQLMEYQPIDLVLCEHVTALFRVLSYLFDG